jgi:hypothetical protein
MRLYAPNAPSERAAFVRDQRCWLDGDLIRLWNAPIGGIRIVGRCGRIPWLMDLSVLEGAMRSVYGQRFCLGDRAPLLQMAVDALAAGDRPRASALADAVTFPAPAYVSTFRSACIQYLSWGPAHRHGNPRIDVEAWLSRSRLERKYDPDQPRVPRGRPNGGQWTDGLGPAEEPGNEPITEDEYETAIALDESIRTVLAERASLAGHIVPVTGKKRPPGRLELITGLAGPFVEALRLLKEMNRLGEAAYLLNLANSGLRELLGYVAPPREWGEIVASSEYREFGSAQAFKDFDRARSSPDAEWHHIVERGADFPEEMKHNTRNMVTIPRAKHWAITRFYVTPNPEFGGATPREWLRGKPYEVHVELGLEQLRIVGALK